MNFIKKLILTIRLWILPTHAVTISLRDSTILRNWVEFGARIYVRSMIFNAPNIPPHLRRNKEVGSYDELFMEFITPEFRELLERFPNHKFRVIVDSERPTLDVRVQYDFTSSSDAMTFRLLIP